MSNTEYRRGGPEEKFEVRLLGDEIIETLLLALKFLVLDKDILEEFEEDFSILDLVIPIESLNPYEQFQIKGYELISKGAIWQSDIVLPVTKIVHMQQENDSEARSVLEFPDFTLLINITDLSASNQDNAFTMQLFPKERNPGRDLNAILTDISSRDFDLPLIEQFYRLLKHPLPLQAISIRRMILKHIDENFDVMSELMEEAREKRNERLSSLGNLSKQLKN